MALPSSGSSSKTWSLFFLFLEKPEADPVHLGHQLSEARSGGDRKEDLHPGLK